MFMKCKKTIRKLSSYLDGELKENENKIVSEHLEKCSECEKVFTALSEQDTFIKQSDSIEPSLVFRTKFWQKVEAVEQAEIKIKIVEKKPKLFWMPVPVMSILLVLIVFQISSFSFAVSVKSQDLKNQVISCVLKNFVTQYNPLNPVLFLNFCEECCETLCKCTQNQGVSSGCTCGKCGGEQ